MRVRWELAICAAAFLAAVWVYYPALGVGLVADDFRIVDRVNFQQARDALHDTVGYGRNEYRPVVAFSFALSNAIWKGDPGGYHLESILLHALNVALLFWWLWLLTDSRTLSGAAAILFAVHPIHHSRVIWIAARDSLPSTLFLLCSLTAYTLARRRADAADARYHHIPGTVMMLSLVCFLLALLSYEGAVVLPGIIVAMEFFMFADQERGIRERLRTAAARAVPFLVVLGTYLVWWVFLFRGETGQYDLDFRFGSMLRNYYRFAYHLLHGHEHLAGVLYFLVACLALFLPRQRRRLLWFAVLIMLIGYLPFVMIAGFASRFAYVSAMGYALTIALLLSGSELPAKIEAAPVLHRARVFVAAGIFLVFAAYYATDLRARIFDWKTAGEIASRIPLEIKSRYPDLPDGSTLVLSRIPVMHGHAYVYPLGLRAALQRLYAGRDLQIIYGPGSTSELTEGQEFDNLKVIRLEFDADTGRMEEISTIYPISS